MNEVAVKVAQELGISAEQAYSVVIEMVRIRGAVVFGQWFVVLIMGVLLYFLICTNSKNLDIENKMTIAMYSGVIGFLLTFLIKWILITLATFIYPEQILIYNLIDKLMK